MDIKTNILVLDADGNPFKATDLIGIIGEHWITNC
jgi:hypothetical protein